MPIISVIKEPIKHIYIAKTIIIPPMDVKSFHNQWIYFHNLSAIAQKYFWNAFNILWGIKTIRLQKFQRNIQKLFRFFGRGDDILFTLLLTLVIICSYFIQSFFVFAFRAVIMRLQAFFRFVGCVLLKYWNNSIGFLRPLFEFYYIVFFFAFPLMNVKLFSFMIESISLAAAARKRYVWMYLYLYLSKHSIRWRGMC